MSGRRGDASSGKRFGFWAGWIFLLLSPVALEGQADLRGRLTLDYNRNEFEGILDQQNRQELELAVSDALFAKNLLTLSYFLERFASDAETEGQIRQRWRTNLLGTYYQFTGELTPRYRLRGTSGSSALFGEGRRFVLVVSPPKAPVVSAYFDRSDRSSGTGPGRIDVTSLDRLVNATHTYRFLNYRALVRERKSIDRLREGDDRRIRDLSGGLGATIDVVRQVNLSADYDYLFTEDVGTSRFEGESVINDVSATATLRPIGWLSAFSSFLGNYIARENSIDQRTSLSEVLFGIRLIPKEYLQVMGTRDYRLIRQDGQESISDFFRAEAILHGRVRDRMEGRASVTRTLVITSQEGSFPSQGYLFNLRTEIYPNISLNTDFNIIQSENPDESSGAFQVRRSLDLRMTPAAALMLNFGAQTLSFGEEISWFTPQISALSLDVNYRPATRMTVILSFAREEDVRFTRRKDFIFTGSLDFMLREGSSFLVLYNQRGTGVEAGDGVEPGGTSFSSAQSGILLQLNLKLRDRASLRLMYDTREVQEGRVARTFGANLVKWF